MEDDMAGVKIISIHALREEGDHCAIAVLAQTFQFLSTPSARRATGVTWKRSKVRF